MNIKEVEELLGITRANIRYYEKEGLLTVERKDNKYREYTEADISVLKRIIVLRKLSVPIGDIRAFFEKEKSLDALLDESVERLQTELGGLKGALNIAKRMESEAKNDFDQDLYFELITREEVQGGKFKDLLKDIAKTELDLIDDTMKHLFFFDFKKHRQNAGTRVGVLLLLFYLMVLFFGRQESGGFLKTFSFPFTVCLCVSLVCFPIMLVKQKLPRLAALCHKIMMILGFLSILALTVMLIMTVAGAGVR